MPALAGRKVTSHPLPVTSHPRPVTQPWRAANAAGGSGEPESVGATWLRALWPGHCRRHLRHRCRAGTAGEGRAQGTCPGKVTRSLPRHKTGARSVSLGGMAGQRGSVKKLGYSDATEGLCQLKGLGSCQPAYSSQIHLLHGQIRDLCSIS
ncbi:unnamed protein product [Coccothraustes coccothraustes]